MLGAGVVCWVAGFDLIYATQDYDFDRREGIRSLVVELGVTRSLRLAQLFHFFMFAALVAFGVVADLGAIYYWPLPLVAGALLYEHRAEKLDLAGINRAFFRSNAFVSACSCSRCASIADRWGRFTAPNWADFYFFKKKKKNLYGARPPWRPPSSRWSSQTRTNQSQHGSSGIKRTLAIERTLASLCWRERRVDLFIPTQRATNASNLVRSHRFAVPLTRRRRCRDHIFLAPPLRLPGE